MSKRANPTVVGSFVLGAIALVVVAIVAFGSGSLFRSRPRAVAYFQGNIQGLTVGAPVTLRGVPVGKVTDIKIEIHASDLIPRVPVYMEFEPERMDFLGFSSNAASPNQTVLRNAIAKGLHARLASQSLVTGQLLVDLSFDPGEKTRTVGEDAKTVEIPTTLSDIEKLKATLSNVPLDEISSTLLQTLRDADQLITSPQISTLLKSLADASGNLDKLTAATAKGLPPLLQSLDDTSKAAQKTLATADTTLNTMQGTLSDARGILNTDMRQALDSSKSAMQRADKLLADAGTLVSQNSAQRYDIDQILQNLSATSRSLRMFSEELDRRPNAVLLGK